MFVNAGDLTARRDGRLFFLTGDVFVPAGLASANSLSLEKFQPVPCFFVCFLLTQQKGFRRLSG